MVLWVWIIPYSPGGAPAGTNVADPDASARRFRPRTMPGCTGTPRSGIIWSGQSGGHDMPRCRAGSGFQRDGQTCPAGFVRCGTVSASCICRRRLKAADRSGDGAGVAHDAGTGPDVPGLKAGQRPVCHGPGQINAAQDCRRVAGQRVQLQPRTPLWWNPPAGQPRPAQGVVSLPDVLSGGAAPVAEPYHPVGLHRHAGDDKAVHGRGTKWVRAADPHCGWRTRANCPNAGAIWLRLTVTPLKSVTPKNGPRGAKIYRWRF